MIFCKKKIYENKIHCYSKRIAIYNMLKTNKNIKCTLLKKIKGHMFFKIDNVNTLDKLDKLKKKGDIFISFTRLKINPLTSHENIIEQKDVNRVSTLHEKVAFLEEGKKKLNYIENVTANINEDNFNKFLNNKNEDVFFKVHDINNCNELLLLNKDDNEATISVFETIKENYNIED